MPHGAWMVLLTALIAPGIATAQIGPAPQPPDPMTAKGDVGAGSPQPPALVTPARPPIEPAQDAASYVLRPGPECADFQALPGAIWKATVSVRFPGPQGEVRVAAGQVLEPGAYVSGLDLPGILQARCH